MTTQAVTVALSSPLRAHILPAFITQYDVLLSHKEAFKTLKTRRRRVFFHYLFYIVFRIFPEHFGTEIFAEVERECIVALFYGVNIFPPCFEKHV